VPDDPQRMIGWYSVLGTEIAKHRCLFGVFAAHHAYQG
ncbi:hypothetical protein LCGC14_1502150, partial [marine sediment metagenome]